MHGSIMKIKELTLLLRYVFIHKVILASLRKRRVKIPVPFHTVTNFRQQSLFDMIRWKILVPRFNKILRTDRWIKMSDWQLKFFVSLYFKD